MKNNKVTVYVFPTPFAIIQREVIVTEWQEGDTVEIVVSRAYPKAKMNCFARGAKVLQPDAKVNPGDNIMAWMVPGDPATITWASVMAVMEIVAKTIITAAWIGSIVYSVYSFVQARKLAKAAKNTTYGKEVSDTSDTNYGWDFDSSNAVTEGSPLPVLYGKRRVIPPVIQQRATVSDLSNKEFLEVIVGVAQGGAGFADTISYPLDEQGDIDILLNHASWKNYVSKTQFVDDSSETINRVNSGISVYNGVYYENGTLNAYGPAEDLSNLKDGNITTRAKSLAGSQNYDSRNSPGFSGTKGTKYTRNFYLVLSNPCKITEVRFYISRAATTFNVYAGNSTNITEFTRIGVFSGNGTKNSWKVCRCNTKGKFYQYVLITDFRHSAKALFYEIEVYGSINTSEEEGYTGYAEVDTRAGSYKQDPMTICNGVWAALNVNKGLNTSWFTFATSTGASPETLAITLEFPYGLYDISGSVMASKTVKIACEYRTVDSAGTPGTWTKFNSDFDASSVYEISDATTDSKKVQLETDENFTAGYDHYEIRMKFYEDPGLSSNVRGACNWTIVEEGYSHKPSYPRTACAAVKMLATENLSGGAPQIKVMAERKYVMVYNSVDAEWQAKPASNPAWAAYDVLVRPVFDDSTLNDLEDELGNVTPLFDEDTLTFAVDPTDYLREEAFPHTRVKYSDFAEWADFCDEEQITMSMYFDGTSSVTDCLQYLCDIGRAGIVNRGNVIGVVVDRSAVNMDDLNNPLPLFNFDDSNIVADTYSENYSDRSNFPTEVQVTYYDKDREYSRKSVIVRNDDSIVNHNTKDVTLYTCDDRDVALRHAEYILNMNLIKKGYAWTGDLDSMPLDMGDLVSIYGNLATITGVTFDDEMRRQFTAVNYSHERFGWEKWETYFNHLSLRAIVLPFAIDGVSMKDLFTIDGAVLIRDSVLEVYQLEDGRLGARSFDYTSEWVPNIVYWVDPLPAALLKTITVYSKPENYTSSVHLAEGVNIISLSFDILDYEANYAYIDGKRIANIVTFQKWVQFEREELVEYAIDPDAFGKINLQTGVAYKVSATEAITFPMFPPE